MIYFPNYRDISEAIGNSYAFETEEQLITYLLNEHNRICLDAGKTETPFCASDIVISDVLFDEPSIIYHRVKKVCIKRLLTTLFDEPGCIGYILEE